MVRINIVNLENRTYLIGYKVVTQDLKSLGLRNNPNILQYPINKWYFLPKEKIKRDSKDYGGIWVTRTLSDAKKLSKYMKDKYNIKTRIFKTTLDQILFFNSYRIKTNGIMLYKEISS